MASSHSSGHHSHDNHDWDSASYVAGWASGQDPKEELRQEPFRIMAETIPYEKSRAITILDVGAGYGALTKFLLEKFPSAQAVCQDGSDEMAKFGKERMKTLSGRFEYKIANFSKPGWTKTIGGEFNAVVSSIAIHNVRDPKIVERVYHDIFPLVAPGGCFLNFDRPRPPWEDQMNWLRDAGFQDVKIFWQGETRAVFGGFRR